MGGQRNVDEGDQVEAERFAGEVGVVARDHLLLLQPHPPPRALRGRQPHEVGQLLVGQPAVVLQRGEHFEVEGVCLDHAQKSGSMHGSCAILARYVLICTHLAPIPAENASNLLSGDQLMGPFPHDAPPATITSDNPMGTDGFEFVEYAHPQPEQLHELFALMGFAPVARHKTKKITVYRQGDVNYLVNEEPGAHGFNFVAAHGPCAPSMAFRIVDAKQAYERAIALGAEPAGVSSQEKTLNVPAIKGIG